MTATIDIVAEHRRLMADWIDLDELDPGYDEKDRVIREQMEYLRRRMTPQQRREARGE